MISRSKNIIRMYVQKMVVALVVVLLPLFSYAQESDLGNWLIYIGNAKIDSKWSIHHEVQYRNYNAVGDLEQLLLRTGVAYNVEDNLNVLLGYGFIHSENYVDSSDEKIDVNEHRIFQQVVNKSKVGIVGLQHRYRFEQRFVEDDFKMRFRYFLGVKVPLKFNENDKYYLSAYNEIFLNSKETVFDRNRLYFGLGYGINDKLRLELGYMNQFFSNSGRDQINVLLFGSF